MPRKRKYNYKVLEYIKIVIYPKYPLKYKGQIGYPRYPLEYKGYNRYP